jgi:hypothetical protein
MHVYRFYVMSYGLARTYVYIRNVYTYHIHRHTYINTAYTGIHTYIHTYIPTYIHRYVHTKTCSPHRHKFTILGHDA